MTWISSVKYIFICGFFRRVTLDFLYYNNLIYWMVSLSATWLSAVCLFLLFLLTFLRGSFISTLFGRRKEKKKLYKWTSSHLYDQQPSRPRKVTVQWMNETFFHRCCCVFCSKLSTLLVLGPRLAHINTHCSKGRKWAIARRQARKRGLTRVGEKTLVAQKKRRPVYVEEN